MSKIDSSLLDKAIVFAVNAHKDVERRGKGFPYIAHPLEAMAIVASMTNDQELLAAACLHDVIEDTDITYEDIKKAFNQRIADLVLSESDVVIPNKDAANSWVERKQNAMDRISRASRDSQMVALGDKLSNMRALARDHEVIGEDLWNRFHVTDPKLHAWHYRGLAKALHNLHDTDAYEEFVYLIEKTFDSRYDEFSFTIDKDDVVLSGEINKASIKELAKALDKSKLYYFDFINVFNINFSGIRALLTLKEEGYRFVIRQASKRIASRFNSVGADREISILKCPRHYPSEGLEQSGDGYTAVTYWTKDGDAMIKLYYDFVDQKEIEQEKRYATSALSLGIPTPLTGDLVEVDGRIGILFERIKNKVSFARCMANDPSRIEELASGFTKLAKKLHSTPCNKDVFINVKEKYKSYVDEMKGLNDKEKEIIKDFIDHTKDVDTCLHGDFHFGNAIITDDNEQLFIDMGDFSYGDPLFDIGTLYLVSHMKDEATTERLFHTSRANLEKFYECFVKDYFDNKYTVTEFDQIIKPYASMTALLFAHKGGEKEWMSYLIKDWLINGYTR